MEKILIIEDDAEIREMLVMGMKSYGYEVNAVGDGNSARAIHLNSERRKKEMLVVDCAAHSEHLFQSELFGYVRGSFTGAFSDKMGLLKTASGSTILPY